MKKTLASLLSLCLVFMMLCATMFTFAACGDSDKNEVSADNGNGNGDNGNGGNAGNNSNSGNGGLGNFSGNNAGSGNDGTYYEVINGETTEDAYLTIKNGQWTIYIEGSTSSGPCVISGNQISLRYVLTGDDDVDPPVAGNAGDVVELYTGTIADGVLNLTWAFNDLNSNITLYLNGKVPGNNGGNGGNTQNPGNTGGNEGMYYLYEDGYLYEDDYLELKGGRWTTIDENGDELGGTYTVSGGTLALEYTLGNNAELDSILSLLGFAQGETVELYTGSIGNGVVNLTDMMGETVDYLYCMESAVQ